MKKYNRKVMLENARAFIGNISTRDLERILEAERRIQYANMQYGLSAQARTNGEAIDLFKEVAGKLPDYMFELEVNQ